MSESLLMMMMMMMMMMISSHLIAQNLADDLHDDSNCCLQMIKNDPASNTSTQKNQTHALSMRPVFCMLCV